MIIRHFSSGKTSKKRSLDEMNEDISIQTTDTQSTDTMSSSSQLSNLVQKPFRSTKKIGLATQTQSRSVARYLRLLDIIYAAIASDTVVTKRDIFYRDAALFGSQSCVDRMVDNLCFYFNTPRANLHITASSKGLVSGPITIVLKSGKRINCKSSKKSSDGHTDHQGCLVPNFSQVNNVELIAKFVIIVEKEATFRDLVSVNSTHSLLKHCIFITGRGYPDISTRHMVKHISINYPDIPILALMDNDPHGLEIYSVYKWGSLSQAFDTANLAVPEIQLLGLCCKDRERKVWIG
ncbi:Spo11/DNA topoisomerase VI subunit A [Phycomyces nitens]|nr:Spo11/DNA topoisomerase VI subunit A [Phycomyces nitens]